MVCKAQPLCLAYLGKFYKHQGVVAGMGEDMKEEMRGAEA